MKIVILMILLIATLIIGCREGESIFESNSDAGVTCTSYFVGYECDEDRNTCTKVSSSGCSDPYVNKTLGKCLASCNQELYAEYSRNLPVNLPESFASEDEKRKWEMYKRFYEKDVINSYFLPIDESYGRIVISCYKEKFSHCKELVESEGGTLFLVNDPYLFIDISYEKIVELLNSTSVESIYVE